MEHVKAATFISFNLKQVGKKEENFYRNFENIQHSDGKSK